ncbi:MAG: dihydrolipoyl dehydrogenase [Alphaproteobacteria bacterium]|nr:dihydrolipoyl dehydrogenase [Alphaproteobacteria bacterium]|tara:strand:- start:25088 stop:26494 length:1407 start_codon:yes stop_codon:yes gene_type:complete
MADKSFDVVVIGAGPGGYVAAIRAAQLGMKTAVIEANHLGGICLNWGCIPTKALLRSAEIYHNMKHAEDYGLKIEGKVTFDLKKIVERSRGVSKQLSGGIGHLLKKNKVTVFDAYGKLAGKGKIVLEKDGKKTDELTAKHIILATGARARVLQGLEPDGKFVWSYKEAMIPEDMPKKLLVVGSGAIGIEFASFYNTLGVDVTVVELMDRVVPVEDEEISALLGKALKKQGMNIITGAKVTKLDKNKDDVTAHIEDAKGKVTKHNFDRIISAVGIVGNVENIGLENTKVQLDRGHIKVDGYLRTDEPGVYAIGDVVSPPWLAHKASHEGVICVEKIAGLNNVHPMANDNIPACTYCHPQVASLGLTEKQCKEKGLKVKIGRFPFVGNGKAIALGEPEGLIKTIFDEKTGELLGAHMVGAEVTELIQGYTIAKTMETTEEDLMHTIFPHPTLSEMMHESVLDAYGRAIHF